MNLSLILKIFQKAFNKSFQVKIYFKLLNNGLMRLGLISVILINATSMQVLFALPVKSQSIDKVIVEIELKNETLSQAFKKIESQTEFRFMYRDAEISNVRHLNIKHCKKSVENVLKDILAATKLTYRQVNSQILIIPQKSNKQALVLGEDNNIILAEKINSPINNFINVNGIVTNVNDEPIVGVNVTVKGTKKGTTTDKQGRFSIMVTEKDILVFSNVGYRPQEVAVNDQTVINIQLIAVAQEMNEVVVTALGVKKIKRGLVYSTAEVKGSEFTEARQNNIASELTGKIAGVDATQVAAGPGASSRVVIRGVGAINPNVNNQPLYVVNGNPIYNGNGGPASSSTGFNYDMGDGISSINPDDIETITVLKSGAAAALYGNLAANGVILITTKSGRINKGIGVDFNSNFTIGTPSSYPNYQYEYGSGNDGVRPATQAAALSAGRLSYGAKIDGSQVIQFDGVLRPYSAVHVKDNIKHFYRPSKDATNTIAFYGGTHALNFRMSLSDLNSLAQTPNSSFNRKTANLNVVSQLGKNDLITIEGNAQYNYETGKNRPNVGYAELNPSWATYLLGNTVDIRSLKPGYSADGNEIQWNPVPAAPNPWFVVNKVGNNDVRNRFIGFGSVQLNILKNLFIKGVISKDFIYSDRYNYVPIGSAFTPKGYYNSYQFQNDINNVRATINYNTGFFKDFSLSTFVGVNRERDNSVTTSITGRDFILPNYINYSNLTYLNPPYRYETHFGTNSVFGSADIDFKKIVYLSLTGRKDWFSTLNPGSNAIFYPSVGAAVILSDAIRMPDVINLLKLRGSWAQVGNSTVSPYAINPVYNLTTGGFNGQPVLNPPNQLLDPSLRPLTVTTSEGGFEAQLFQGGLGLDMTYYYRLTTNNILQPDISNTTGYLAGDQNVGTLSNRGIELLLTGTPLRNGKLTWNISYNMAWNKNQIISLAPGLKTLTIGNGIGGMNIISQVGLPYATLQGMVFLKSTDGKGQQVYNSVSGYEANVLANLGVANPPYTMGLTNEFRYKRFSLNILLDAKFGAVGFSNLWQYASRFGLTNATLPGREAGLQLSGVDQNGSPFSKFWAVDLLDTYYNNRGSNYPGSVCTFKTDFVKLRSLIFSYNIPIQRFKLVNIQSVSIALVARNLAILYRDKLVKEAGLDPEFQQTVGNAQGTQGTGEPVTRNIGLNLNVKF